MTQYYPNRESRRAFLSDVGRSMVAASVGAAVASDLGFSTAFAEENDENEIKFGKLEPLVSVMRDTPPEKLQPLLVKKLQNDEATLKDLTAAGALANARTFGGEDYDGFHCMFALVPALEMSAELPVEERPLPVLKVLYRNTARMQLVRKENPKDVLRAIDTVKLPKRANPAELLRQAVRAKDSLEGDRILGALTEHSAQKAYNALQLALRDKPNVHAVALAHRAWEMVDLIGEANAHTLLRQSVHFSCSAQNYTKGGIIPELQRILANRLDALAGKTPGLGEADDRWVAKMAHTIYASSRAQAAEAVADALAEGISPEVVGEAISLAANEIILRQTKNRTHGDSRGVHSSDAVNAWRNIARVTDDQNRYASMIVAAYHVAGAGQNVIGPKSPLSDAEDVMALFRDRATETQPDKLLVEAEEAIRANDQFGAAAAVLRYSQIDGVGSRPVFDLMLKYALSEDGRLHAEKYYRTVTEEFGSVRPAYRWRELIALARVTASTYGMTRNDQSGGRAPGYLEARGLLGLG